MEKKRPYVISHMMTSVDGRIDCPMLEHLSTDEYYVALAKLGTCSKLSGRVTAALECPAVKGERVTDAAESGIGRESWHRAAQAEEYEIVVDTLGKLEWAAATADGLPVLCILSERVSEAYLAQLEATGISYVVTGKDGIDLPRAMEMLYANFGVERLAIVGGGHVNGGFLEAGLIDEVSLMIAPGIDGRQGQTAVFDGLKCPAPRPYHLKLVSVEQWETEIVWMRYLVKGQAE